LEKYIATPLSRKSIEKIATNIRILLGLSPSDPFNAEYFLELVLPRLDDKFHLVVLSKEEMLTREGLAKPEQHVIELREDVYEGAIAGNPRDRFTVAHELGHYFMHNSQTVALARGGNGKKIPVYQNPEWQANAFAADILMPPDGIRGMCVEEVMEHFGVSRSAAKIQLSRI